MRRRATIGATALLLAVGLVGLVLNVAAPAGSDQTRASEVIALGTPLVFSVLGGFLVLRRRQHPAGWMLGLIGISLTCTWLGDGVIHQAAGGAAWAAGGILQGGVWLENWTWPAEFGAIVVLLLRFPDGRLRSRRWRGVEIGTVVVCGVQTLLLAVQTSTTDDPGVVLPLDLGPVSRFADLSGSAALFPVVVVGLVAAAVSLILRRRHATGAAQAQLRWLFWAAALMVGSLLVAVTIQAVGAPQIVHDAWDLPVQLSIYSLPIAVVVAVNRHGLFEIDRVIGRTVSYSVLTAILTAAYTLIVASVSELVPAALGSLAVVAATLAVAALFVPVRRRVQRVVDRRFNRARFDADGVVAAFAERTRAGAGQASTQEDLVIAVRQVFEPAHASVWLAPGRRAPH